jgi:hypothetical protein
MKIPLCTVTTRIYFHTKAGSHLRKARNNGKRKIYGFAVRDPLVTPYFVLWLAFWSRGGSDCSCECLSDRRKSGWFHRLAHWFHTFTGFWNESHSRGCATFCSRLLDASAHGRLRWHRSPRLLRDGRSRIALLVGRNHGKSDGSSFGDLIVARLPRYCQSRPRERRCPVLSRKASSCRSPRTSFIALWQMLSVIKSLSRGAQGLAWFGDMGIVCSRLNSGSVSGSSTKSTYRS